MLHNKESYFWMRGMNIIMLTPMNHREIEYNVKKFWVSEKIMEKNIANIFCVWNNETEKKCCNKSHELVRRNAERGLSRGLTA